MSTHFRYALEIVADEAVIVLAILLALTTVPRPARAQNFNTSTSFCIGVDHTVSVTLGDLDGDRDLDLIFGNGRHLPQTDWVYSNDGKGNFIGRRSLGDKPDKTYGVALGDIDADGDLDAVSVGDVGELGKILTNDGRGNFFAAWTFGSNAYASRDVKLADLDGDRDLDIVVGNTIFGQNLIYINDGSGKFRERKLGPGKQLTLALQAGDLDGDGDVDIITGNRGTPTVAYLNDGAGNFSDTRTIGSGKDLTVALGLGDLDGDGDLDVVTGNWDARPQIHVNDGKAQFTLFGAVEPASQTYALALGDLDLDGDLDLVVANWGPRTQQVDSDGNGVRERWVETSGHEMSRVYLNDGRAKFATSYAFGVGNDRFRAVALGDVDRDGDLDIVAGSDCHTNKVFYNSTLPKQTK